MLTPHVSVEQVSFWAAAEMARRKPTETLSTTLARPMPHEMRCVVEKKKNVIPDGPGGGGSRRSRVFADPHFFSYHLFFLSLLSWSL